MEPTLAATYNNKENELRKYLMLHLKKSGR